MAQMEDEPNKKWKMTQMEDEQKKGNQTEDD